MTERQEKLLQFIIKEYIKTAQPVGSQAIAQKTGLALSSATIRNEMAALENEGYIFQPHTSAGRVPTEKGYQWYADAHVAINELDERQKELLNKIVREGNGVENEMIKFLAKGIAHASDQAVFVGFSPRNVYYTGISNLFNQPEFSEQQLVFRMSHVIDHLDQVMFEIFDQIDEGMKILIGRHNPFSHDCSTVLTKYTFHGERGMLGILGPLRMNYQNNVNLIHFSQQFINKL